MHAITAPSDMIRGGSRMVHLELMPCLLYITNKIDRNPLIEHSLTKILSNRAITHTILIDYKECLYPCLHY